MVQEISSVKMFDDCLNNKYVIVDFYTTWCGPCKMIAPKFNELAEKYTDINFYKVDADNMSDISETYHIESLPTFLFFLDGVNVSRVCGANVATLQKKIDDLIAMKKK